MAQTEVMGMVFIFKTRQGQSALEKPSRSTISMLVFTVMRSRHLSTTYIFDGFIGFNNGSLEALFPGSEVIRRETNLLVGTTNNPPTDIKVLNSHLHIPDGTYGTNLYLGYRSDGNNLEVSDNYLSGGFRAIDLNRWSNFVIRRNKVVRYRAKYARPMFVDFTGTDNAGIDQNTYYDALPNTDAQAFGWNGQVETMALWRTQGFDVNSSYQVGKPSPEVFVRPNAYEIGRAHIVVYNWNNSSAVSIDLRATGLALGDNYEIRDVQNFFGPPVFSGKYDGTAIQLIAYKSSSSPLQ